MANTSVLKRSVTPGKIPPLASMEIGELAVNLTDKVLYCKITETEIAALNLPTLSEVFEASSDAEMTALQTVQVGEVCLRTDLKQAWILQALPASTYSNWKMLSNFSTSTPLAAIQVRRATTLALTTTATNVTFSNTDLENAPSVISALPNSQNININASGLYLFIVGGTVKDTTAATLNTLRLKRNNVPLVGGTQVVNPRSTNAALGLVCVANLSAGDIITLDAASSAGTTGTIQANLNVVGFRLDSIQNSANTFPTTYLFAEDLDNPNNANWAVNTLAPVLVDAVNPALTVRAFDDTLIEGVGFKAVVPRNATNLEISIRVRASTATISNNVIFQLHKRVIGGAVGAWQAQPINVANIDNSTNYKVHKFSYSLSVLGAVEGNLIQLELTRVGNNAGDTLIGDLLMSDLVVGFS